jgi:hypothetical protein
MTDVTQGVHMPTELFAGPWLGEFGWELMQWQAVVRAASRRYDRTIVCSFPGRAALYADFAAEFVAHPFIVVPDMARACRGTRPSDGTIDALVPRTSTARLSPGERYRNLTPEFIRYGTPQSEYRGCLVFHARMRRDWGTGRNWPVELWERLGERLASRGDAPPTASIGALTASTHVPHSLDLRGINLCALMDVIASAALVVGPSSGPMHLASLCGTAHLVWVGEHRLVSRYRKDWNPLQTPCRVLDCGWRPDVSLVEAEIIGYLDELRRRTS